MILRGVPAICKTESGPIPNRARAAPAESRGRRTCRRSATSCRLPSSAPPPSSHRSAQQQACPLPSSRRHRSRRGRSSRQQHLPQASQPQLRRSFGRRGFHFLGTRMMDRDDRLVAAVRESTQLHARGQRNVRQALDVVDLHRRQVELEELGQILRQARSLRTSLSRCDTTPPCVFTPGEPAAPLKCSGMRMRIFSFSSTRCRSMCRIWFFAGWRCTSLRIAACVFAVDLQRQDRREEALVDQQRQQVLVIENDLARLVVPAVEDRRNFPGSAQAAARTLPLHAVTRHRRRVQKRSSCHLSSTNMTRRAIRSHDHPKHGRTCDQSASRTYQFIRSLVYQSMYSELTLSSSRMRRIVSASKPATRQLADLRAALRVLAQRNRVGHDQLVELRLRDALDRRTRQHRRA